MIELALYLAPALMFFLGMATPWALRRLRLWLARRRDRRRARRFGQTPEALRPPDHSHCRCVIVPIGPEHRDLDWTPVPPSREIRWSREGNCPDCCVGTGWQHRANCPRALL